MIGLRPRPATDLQLLEAIYENAARRYPGPDGPQKTYIPVDLDRVAHRLRCPIDEVWGRLYYVLDHKHGYTDSNGSKVSFFAPALGDLEQCIHFPMLSGVLAGERDALQRDRSTRGIALMSAIVSLVSLAWTLFHS